jgi:hypothetical protein
LQFKSQLFFLSFSLSISCQLIASSFTFISFPFLLAIHPVTSFELQETNAHLVFVFYPLNVFDVFLELKIGKLSTFSHLLTSSQAFILLFS